MRYPPPGQAQGPLIHPIPPLVPTGRRALPFPHVVGKIHQDGGELTISGLPSFGWYHSSSMLGAMHRPRRLGHRGCTARLVPRLPLFHTPERVRRLPGKTNPIEESYSWTGALHHTTLSSAFDCCFVLNPTTTGC